MNRKDPNYDKYYAYRLAHKRMKTAFEAGYPLETITIAESIITDRLLSHANFHGARMNPDRTPLGPALNHFRKHPGTVDPSGHDELVERIEVWSRKRNQTLHGVAKSAQGEGPAVGAEDFVDHAFEVGRSGMDLVASVKRWIDVEMRAGKASK